MDWMCNKGKWSTFTDDQMSEYQKLVFDHYRSTGYPYFPTSMEYRRSEMAKTKSYDYTKCIDEPNKTIKQSMHGLSLCWSYHPHYIEISCNNMKTPLETFLDDEKLKGVIAKRVKYGDNMSDNGLRKILKVYTGVQCVSNFRPTAAAAIYHKWCPKGGKVWDMSGGFGGRLLGAHLAGVEYVATEPSTKTFDGLVQMRDDFNINGKIHNHGSEVDLDIAPESIDLCFTSPPYFDCEVYADEPTQSCHLYPTQDKWLNCFMRDTMINCHTVLKAGGHMVINIAKVRSYPNLVDDVQALAVSLGFTQHDTWWLQLSRLGKGGHKTEPILVFTKGECSLSMDNGLDWYNKFT